MWRVEFEEKRVRNDGSGVLRVLNYPLRRLTPPPLPEGEALKGSDGKTNLDINGNLT